MSEVFSVATVAQMLDCSTWTVRRRIHAGELRAVRDHGRMVVRSEDLRAYVDALEAVGATATSRRRPAPKDFGYLSEQP